MAIVVGLIAGAVCALKLRRTPWKSLVSVSVVALVVAVAFPFGGFLAGLPTLVSLAVFASVFYVVRGGVLFANGQGDMVDGISNVGRWIAITYVFWTVASLANFQLLGLLAIPPVILVSPEAIGRFLPFILPPLGVALLVGVFITALVVRRHASTRHAAPFIFNACVLVAFFVSADLFRHQLMSRSLEGHTPSRLERSSFLASVLKYRTYFRDKHGGFEENGKTYRWSYTEREFVQRPEASPSLEHGR
jgi:hypothetical protein